MTIFELIEKIERLGNGGISTDESRWDEDYLISILNTFRAQLIRDYYIKNNKRINPSCYQQFYCIYDKNIQDAKSGYVKFACPPVMSMDGGSDGLRFIGSSEGSEGFRRIRSRAVLSTYNSHKVMSVKNNSRFTSVLYNGSDNTLEVYGNPLVRECLVEGVFSNPMDLPLYNPNFDNYPVGDDMIPMLEAAIFSSQTSIESRTQTDSLNNRTDIIPPQYKPSR